MANQNSTIGRLRPSLLIFRKGEAGRSPCIICRYGVFSSLRIIRPAFLTLAFCFFMALATNGEVISLQTPRSVDEEIFRSRWVGEQMDRFLPPNTSYLPPSMSAADQSILLPTFREMSSHMGDGILLGPLEIRPVVEFGWEYSSQTSTGDPTSSKNSNSFFVAPSLALVYEREVGAWSLSARYGGGYTYYTNPEYMSAGTGSQRNPFQQTGSIELGVQGSQYRLNAQVGAAYGSGFDVEAGEANTQFNLNGSIHGDYQYSEWLIVGGDMSTKQTLSSDTEDSPDGELSSYRGTLYGNYLWTGRTSLQVDLSAGREGQALGGDTSAARQYTQALFRVNYIPTGKLTLSGAAGFRYVDASGIVDATDVGFLPAYSLSINYRPTEKITLALSSSLEGADIRPKFRLSLLWEAREKTAFSLALYQSQEFSSILDSQVRETRGVVGAVTQEFFGCVDTNLSAGYEQWSYINASGDSELGDNNGGTHDSQFVSLAVTWKIQEWARCRALVWAGTDGGNVSSNSPSIRVSLGLNITF
jgi:hypothetical protein